MLLAGTWLQQRFWLPDGQWRHLLEGGVEYNSLVVVKGRRRVLGGMLRVSWAWKRDSRRHWWMRRCRARG